MKQASEVIKPFMEQHPDKKFAITPTTLGCWAESEQRYIPFATQTICGDWVFMPYEILANGQRIKYSWSELQS